MAAELTCECGPGLPPRSIKLTIVSQGLPRESATETLVNFIAHLKAKVDAGSVSCVTPYQSALSTLAALDREAARGAQVRSRIRWVEEGETSFA